MSVSEEFDEWARDGRDEGMEERHWHTAKHALSRMPVEEGETVLDLGCGSGYAGRALRETNDAARTYGIDASPEMARNARSYTDDPRSGFLNGDFEHLPFDDDSIDHCWSMEAFFYARDPDAVLEELHRVLRPGGTFYCAVNYWEESVHTHRWEDLVDVPMIRWTEREYRERFREAGFHVAGQDRIPDTETELPPAGEFPIEGFETREEMVERYREHGTLLTVGVAP
ncbi:class I SAM-dependent methyltransferase [Halosimplex sp. TS25]|uniref:class I SAM-dependent methyltransferase n=1 Tax=Halosimplex rarum TaxID=3396619 RepID=UPI0039EB4C77